VVPGVVVCLVVTVVVTLTGCAGEGRGGTGDDADRRASTSAPGPTGSGSGTATTGTPAQGTTATPTPTGGDASTSPRYVFPIDPAGHASFGKAHHDYPATDIFAPCGDGFLAPIGGTVLELGRKDVWDPAENDPAVRGGLFVSLLGDDGVRYYGSHLSSVTRGLAPGDRVSAGTRLGRVGRTGNARSTPCHVHFGISPVCSGGDDWWLRRGVVSPYPYLRSWRDGEHRNPARAVTAWESEHGCPAEAP